MRDVLRGGMIVFRPGMSGQSDERYKNTKAASRSGFVALGSERILNKR
ncbi:Uncharacterised protein [Aedoeadaptatus ivorii]|uniref:Uncharacterized protein n=1 Tax=Aedoeadaptatus ivorii TaxID=54006 RepID=A0A448V2T1_9FIRM|nr:hypothetical protein [Peptoniphilus ivorii]VEJ36099.1 Uncharacterised protein [Peptoniphilus ivorii]